jgi:hypothetical protein
VVGDRAKHGLGDAGDGGRGERLDRQHRGTDAVGDLALDPVVQDRALHGGDQAHDCDERRRAWRLESRKENKADRDRDRGRVDDGGLAGAPCHAIEPHRARHPCDLQSRDVEGDGSGLQEERFEDQRRDRHDREVDERMVRDAQPDRADQLVPRGAPGAIGEVRSQLVDPLDPRCHGSRERPARPQERSDVEVKALFCRSVSNPSPRARCRGESPPW